ncbi:glycosyltransferase family 4 protein [Polynucleobacter sp. MWH-Mekk-B1]|uniref:glycosyltransferase family 4 protein n=1 Tax=Polynucleobacter finlandensis TaxID=1855894 RepID=UPI001C0DB5C5|nr:glycosyltransferase family 1 protein [Polynucleobacter finlandensis]MBU3543966.1 glycosyltransferase family 4 protein [Polynucleobacter finlandensis]
MKLSNVTIKKNIKVGIDAANLRGGGGVTHLVELLRATEPDVMGIEGIIVWGGTVTLNLIDDRPWIKKCFIAELDRGLLRRTIWQRFSLSKVARQENCDVLFVPGGSYAGSFSPMVTMSRNLLPFETKELGRYGLSFSTIKLLILRCTQSYSYKHAQAVIFLTKYAFKVVSNWTGTIKGLTCVIPHGLNPRFFNPPKLQRHISNYGIANPYRIIYVSTIDQYKHQWHVIEAIDSLRKSGMHIALDLIGSYYPPALKRLKSSIAQYDPQGNWVSYLESVPFNDLHSYYSHADLGLFASSCENMPNILLETMASGLPIAASNRGPMPEILGSAGVYFDPEKPSEIARALSELINSPHLRADLSKASYDCAIKYSWHLCARKTYQFMIDVTQGYKGTT